MSGPMGLVSKGVVYVSFIFAKQPSRIRSVLMQVCYASHAAPGMRILYAIDVDPAGSPA